MIACIGGDSEVNAIRDLGICLSGVDVDICKGMSAILVLILTVLSEV